MLNRYHWKSEQAEAIKNIGIEVALLDSSRSAATSSVSLPRQYNRCFQPPSLAQPTGGIRLVIERVQSGGMSEQIRRLGSGGMSRAPTHSSEAGPGTSREMFLSTASDPHLRPLWSRR